MAIVKDNTVSINTDCVRFRDYLDSLTIREHGQIIDTIVQKCFVSRITVYNWKSGRSKIKQIYKSVIEEIAGTKIFD